MDWQQVVALLIVSGTAGVFVWSQIKARRKKFSFEKDTHCGCSSGHRPAIGPAQTIQFRARKGERPSILVKNQ